MNKNNTCIICSRIYRGEGYQGVCTSECYWKDQYAKKYKKPIRKKRQFKYLKGSEKPKEPKATKANARWIKDEKSEPKTREEKNRISALLTNKHVRHAEWTGRQYGSVRG